MLEAHLLDQGVMLVCCPTATSGKVSAKQRRRKQRRAGWSWWDHGRDAGCILLPAWGQSLQPCHDLSVLVKWMGEEEKVPAPCPPWVGSRP